jgi:hypothetical protein
MTEENLKPKLAAGELANIWEYYMNNSFAAVVLEYFHSTTESQDVKTIVKDALAIANFAKKFSEKTLTEEKYPKPKGFTNQEDLNPNAPKMYTDIFILYYIHTMAQLGLPLTSIELTEAVRKDIRQFYTERLNKMMDLFDRSLSLLLEKGVFVRPPTITSRHDFEPKVKKGFLGNILDDDRELTACEANELHKNVFMNHKGKSLMTGFRQSVNTPNLKNLLQKGQELASEIMTTLSSILIANDLPVSMSSDTHVTDAEIAPFSDKLICYHIDFLNKLGLAGYGFSAAISTRNDLRKTYGKIMTKVFDYENDIKDYMIKHQWLEKPPIALDRDHLSKN